MDRCIQKLKTTFGNRHQKSACLPTLLYFMYRWMCMYVHWLLIRSLSFCQICTTPHTPLSPMIIHRLVFSSCRIHRRRTINLTQPLLSFLCIYYIDIIISFFFGLKSTFSRNKYEIVRWKSLLFLPAFGWLRLLWHWLLPPVHRCNDHHLPLVWNHPRCWSDPW